jgi:uncharacterized protein YdhG (YjbR/CyaY superfamily)
MAVQSGNRKAHFPAIEKKYGQPMSYWFNQMDKVSGQKYPDQIAFLRENHGFSQTHANALVMYSRGSTTSKRFTTIDQFLEPLDETKQKTVLAIFKAIKTKYPKMEVVIAWNTPMLKLNNEYIFGVSVLKNHLLIAPWGDRVIERFADRLTDYKVNKKTIQVPIDWKIDKKLLQDLVAARVAEL